jgi:hypothetical protein
MTDEQLWAFVRDRMRTLRTALDEGEARWTVAERLTAIESALSTLAQRGAQRSLTLLGQERDPSWTPHWREGA